MVAAFALKAALTESDLRTALWKWAIGDKVIQDPHIAVLDYFDDSRTFVTTNTWITGAIADGTNATTLVTVTGAELGDPAVASLAGIEGTAMLLTAAASNDVVRLTLYNDSGASFTSITGTVKVIVFHY